MNKQEFIEKLKMHGAWCTECHDINGEADRYVKFAKVRELLEQVDEPIDALAQEYDVERGVIREWLDRGHKGSFEKVVVPEFVAEKMKYYKSALWMLSSEYFDSSSEIDSDELANWIEQNSENFFRAWLDGYTVKPKRWVVKDSNDQYVYDLHLNRAINTAHISHGTTQISNGTTLDVLDVLTFADHAKADAVATLVEGSVEEV